MAQATTRTEHGDAALAWSVAAAAEDDRVVGTVPVQDGDTTVTIHSGNTGSVFALSAAGVVTIDDKTDLVAGSSYTLVIRVVETVTGHVVTSDTSVVVTVTE